MAFWKFPTSFGRSHNKTRKRCSYSVVCVFFVITGLVLYHGRGNFSFEYWLRSFRPGSVPNILVRDHGFKDFIVYTPGCHIPAFAVFDPLVEGFYEKEETIDCTLEHSPQLVDSNTTALFVVKEALAKYNVTDSDDFRCCYRSFWRVEGDLENYKRNVDNVTRFEKNYMCFKNEIAPDGEFVEVTCYVNETQVYKDYHAFVPLKPNVEARCATKSMGKGDEDYLSVLILGIDGVSRLNFHRQMPLTSNFLSENGGIEMLGYNKVGESTFPNLVPVLAGLSVEELRETCWQRNNVSFDLCPLLWKSFGEAGYRTAYGEDSPYLGTFNYLKAGFVEQPTDYYTRPYISVYEGAAGHTKLGNTQLCLGSRLSAEVLLQYASRFSRAMASKRSFGFFWENSLTHDFLNYPQLGDELYRDFLRNLVETNALNRTLLVVISDHGIRWGGITGTYQGSVEERLPLLNFVFPGWFKKKYSKAVDNLNRNVRKLTTPFDVYETLMDLLYLGNLEKHTLRRRTARLDWKSSQRGVSLFLPIDGSRICETAGVATHYCTCHQSEPMPTRSPIVNEMARYAVNFLNDLLKPHAGCSKLRLKYVRSARVQYPVEYTDNDATLNAQKDYVLVFVASPGGGVFEATVKERQNTSLSVSGTVSRLNMYGKQSACVEDSLLKLYCYCGSPFSFF